jgi:hypothetical protein
MFVCLSVFVNLIFFPLILFVGLFWNDGTLLIVLTGYFYDFSILFYKYFNPSFAI